MKFLAPMKNRPIYHEPVEKAIEAYLYEVIFKPIVAIIKENTKQSITLLNAPSQKIIQALRSGKIQYTDGIFSGKFNAELGKEMRDIGAQFDWRSNVYRLDAKLIPESILRAAQEADAKSQKAHDNIRRKLDEIENGITEVVLPSDHVVSKIHDDFKTAAKQLIVTPELSTGAKHALSDEYNNSLKLHIQNWKQEQITKLRSRVEENSKAGARFDNLIQRVQEQYSVSQSKARFLASQETALFMTNFQKERLLDAGVTVFKWSARGPSLTRPIHWLLNGKFFRYVDPPVVNEKGDRKLPGQDYGPCLCVSIPALGYDGKIGL